MIGPPPPEPSSLVEKERRLAELAESQLRDSMYRNKLRGSASVQSVSDWGMIAAGAILTMLVPKFSDLMNFLDIADVKILFGGFVVSGALGLVAKICSRVLEKDIQKLNPYSEEFGAIVKEYFEKTEVLIEEAKKIGNDLPRTLNSNAMLGPFEARSKDLMPKISAELKERAADPHRKWKEPLFRSKIHFLLVTYQMLALISTVIFFVAMLHAPISK